MMPGPATEDALYALVRRDLDRMLLSVPKIQDAETWAVIKSRFDLIVERLEYFADTSESLERRQVFRNAITKLRSIAPKRLACAAS